MKYGSLQGCLSSRRSDWMRDISSATVALALLCQTAASHPLCAAQQDDGKIATSLQNELKDATLRAIIEEPGQIGPIRLNDIELGTPRKITRYGGGAHFFRVPIIHKPSKRQIGYTDLKENPGEKLKIVRRSVPKIEIARDDAIAKLPPDTLELTPDQIVSRAAAKVGKDSKPLNGPTLVYDRSETRVAWAVTIRPAAGSKDTTVLVTQRFTYEPRITRVMTGFRGTSREQ